MRLVRFTRVARVRGVDIDLHWSVLLIATVILIGAFKSPLLSIVGGTCWVSVLVLHECGHLLMAQRKHSEVFGIEVYPLWAITHYQTPWSRLDAAAIAWGGVLAQAVVGIPLVVYVAVFGYTPWEPVNAVLALFGPFSLAMAGFNLLPFAPLDGSKAWDLFPALWQHRQKTQAAGWRK